MTPLCHCCQALPPMKFLRKYLLSKCPDDGELIYTHTHPLPSLPSLTHTFAATKSQLQSAWDAGASAPVGLLLNQRMVNIPPHVVPPMHDCLLKDLQWARKNEISAEHRDQFKLASFLVVSPCFFERQSKDSTASGAGGGAGAAAPTGAASSEPIFYRFEEEEFWKVPKATRASAPS